MNGKQIQQTASDERDQKRLQQLKQRVSLLNSQHIDCCNQTDMQQAHTTTALLDEEETLVLDRNVIERTNINRNK
ncbi:MAG TPA: hypothetical protein V6C81_04480 [Planktothrix sp.]|jgi:hypothetical protein